MRLIITLLLYISVVVVATPRSEIADGNRLFRDGDFEGAAKAYKRASELDSDNTVALYNLGAAYARGGLDDDALDAFRTLASKSIDKKLLADVQRNIAAIKLKNSLDIESLQSQDDIDEKIEAINDSIEYLNRARQISPSGNEPIDKGIELARLHKNALEQIKEQLAQQQKDRQQMKDALDELSKQQQAQAEQSKQQADSDEQDESKQQQLSQEQQQTSEKTNEAKQKATELSAQDEQMKDVEQKIDEAMQKQAEAQENLDEGDFEKASELQEQAAEKLKEAKEMLEGCDSEKCDKSEADGGDGESQEQNEQQTDSQQDEDNQEQDSSMAEPEDDRLQEEQEAQAAQTAQEILDKERENKRQRVLIRTQQRQVERDW